MKKVLYRKIIHGTDESFSHIKYDQFSMPLHSHEELELILITGGTGKQFVNDGVREYKKDDLTLIGSNVPHLHLCESLLNPKIEEKSSCEMIQFPVSILPADINNLHEFKYICRLLDNSRYGIRFNGKNLIENVRTFIYEIEQIKGIERIITILKILDMLSRHKTYELVSGHTVNIDLGFHKQNEPLTRIYAFLEQNFKRPVSLSEIAENAGMNPTALCRYFKRHTDKSIFYCLTEIRVGYAGRLLLNSELNIAQIAYESGFNNLSHFNKQFREVTKQTPREYRNNIISL